MASTPASVEIRAYQVGFGDCFVLSFVYSPANKKHVLIDFGTTGLPKRGKTALKPKGADAFAKNDSRIGGHSAILRT